LEAGKSFHSSRPQRGDLTGADIRGAFLTGANLSRADLTGANLTGANLWGANLAEAILSRANLSKAYLARADLTGAKLGVANLTGADLQADLTEADLTGADLREAYFTAAIIAAGETPFAMLQDLWINYPDRVFRPIYYSSVDALIASLDEKIIRPAEARFVELVRRKNESMGGEHV
jgi:Pentapeptide repeats (8 copies)